MKRATNKIQLWTFENFSSSEECYTLILEADKKGYVESKVQNSKDTSKMNMKTMSRNSTTSFISKTEIGSIFEKKARDAIKSVNNGSDTIGSQIDNLKLEGLQVQKYEPGQKYNPHYDTFADKDGSDQRSWTVMVYLNENSIDNDLKGGSTYFPKIDFRVDPKKGMAVIWNNLNNEYCRDENTLHTGEKVTCGKKIIVTMWFKKPASKKFLCKNPNFLNPASKKSKTEFKKEMFSYNIDKTGWYILFFIFTLVILCVISFK